MPDILDSLSKPAVGYAAGLVGGFGRDLVNFFMNRANNEANSRLALNQNRYNLEQWERETAYNSPAAQMARLREAGINPHLAYSQGQVMNEAASSPDMTAATYQPFQAQTSFDPTTFAQINLLNAQAQQARSNAALADSQLPEAQQRILKMQQEIAHYKAQITLYDYQCSEIAARVKNLDQDTKLKVAQTDNISFEQALKREDLKLRMDQVAAEIRKLDADTNLTNRQVYELVQTFASRKYGLDLDNNLKSSEKKYYDSLIDKMEKEMSLIDQQITGQGYQNQILQSESMVKEHEAQLSFNANNVAKDGYLARLFSGMLYLTREVFPINIGMAR